MSNKFKTIVINGISYEVSDQTKLIKPTVEGTEGQILAYKDGEPVWITPSNNPGGTDNPIYTEGEGINISDNTISVDFNEVARKTDIITYKEGTGIDITEDGTISCITSEGQPYSAGNGISISSDNKISIKGVQHFDEPQDGFIGLFTDENGLHFAGEALLVTKQELSDYVTKDDLSDYVTNKQLGDINAILDAINGEEV